MTQSSSPTRFSVTLPASGKPAYLGMWTWMFQRASSLILMVLERNRFESSYATRFKRSVGRYFAWRP
jgi:hypothetical protein